MVVKAFSRSPSPTPMIEMLLAAGRFPEFAPRVDQVCADYASDFEKNKEAYAEQDGYNLRLEAARLALMRLEHVARSHDDSRTAEIRRQAWRQYQSDRDAIAARKRW